MKCEFKVKIGKFIKKYHFIQLNSYKPSSRNVRWTYVWEIPISRAILLVLRAELLWICSRISSSLSIFLLGPLPSMRGKKEPVVCSVSHKLMINCRDGCRRLGNRSAYNCFARNALQPASPYMIIMLNISLHEYPALVSMLHKITSSLFHLKGVRKHVSHDQRFRTDGVGKM